MRRLDGTHLLAEEFVGLLYQAEHVAEHTARMLKFGLIAKGNIKEKNPVSPVLWFLFKAKWSWNKQKK